MQNDKKENKGEDRYKPITITFESDGEIKEYVYKSPSKIYALKQFIWSLSDKSKDK